MNSLVNSYFQFSDDKGINNLEEKIQTDIDLKKQAVSHNLIKSQYNILYS